MEGETEQHFERLSSFVNIFMRKKTVGSRSLSPPILNISSWLSIQCQQVHLELCEKQKFSCVV